MLTYISKNRKKSHELRLNTLLFNKLFSNRNFYKNNMNTWHLINLLSFLSSFEEFLNIYENLTF